jgi:L-fuconolactonase
MRHLLDCFGAERLLWGSDWPVLELAAGYDAWNDITDRFLQDLNPEDRQRIRGGNAQTFYGL